MIGAFLATTHLLFAAKPTWKPVTPEELAETEPKIEKEAPAEAVFVQHEVDDRDFPRERVITEYIRYKIYVPDRVENITRISGIDSTAAQSRTELRARLVLPDGRTQEFGKEAIQERTLSKKAEERGLLAWLAGGGDEVKEKFLAVSGVEAGAVLDYQITRRQSFAPLATSFVAQRQGVPVRSATYVFRISPESDLYAQRLFVSNHRGADVKEDRKTRTSTVTATNIPSLVREPFLGPFTDYAFTIVHSYHPYTMMLVPRSGKVPVPGTIDSKFGPWAPFSTMMNWFERDRTIATPRVKQLAAEITAEAVDSTAKAIAIHAYVQNHYQKFLRRPGSRPPTTEQPQSLDDIIDYEKNPAIRRDSIEFLWLAIGLYKAAGLECVTVMLPSRTFSRFNPQNVCSAFLNHRAAAVRIDGEWRFSEPQSTYRLPFGMLPWDQEAMPALLALDRKQEFIRPPPTPADKSVTLSKGKFKIDSTGTLTGECAKSFTGQTAVTLRAELRRLPPTRRSELIRARLGVDPKAAEITGLKVVALDDAEQPLVVTCRIRWPGFAARLKDRMIVKPAVFRAETSSPFTASERRHPVHFPYRWQELDRVEIQLPPGYEPEAPTAPAPRKSEVVSYETKISYDRTNRTIHLAREFISNPLDLAVEFYPALKAWYDHVALSDQHEVVFLRSVQKKAPETPAAGNGN
jgi:hypothetical protein